MSSSTTQMKWGSLLLYATAWLYIGAVLVIPLATLGTELAQLLFAAEPSTFFSITSLDPLFRSFQVTTIVVIVNAVVGVGGALVLVRHKFPGRALINALVDLPLAISPVMIGLGVLLVVGRDGWFGPFFESLGIRLTFSFSGLVIATLFVTLPYTLREVAYVLEELGTVEEEAASTLGASPWQILWLVTLPNIRLALGYGLLMALARSLGEFGAVLVLGGGISGETQTATTFIHDALEERDIAGAYGMAALLCSISVGLLATLELLKRRINQKS
jgi:sulfate/thiosulfate transport system permease protein